MRAVPSTWTAAGIRCDLVGPHPRRHRHERVGLVDLEEFRGALDQHGGREGAERLALLDARVELVLDGDVAGVGQDRPVAERARAHLEAALEPADDLALGQAPRHLGDELRLAEPPVAQARLGRARAHISSSL